MYVYVYVYMYVHLDNMCTWNIEAPGICSTESGGTQSVPRLMNEST